MIPSRWRLVLMCICLSGTAVAQRIPAQNANYQRVALQIPSQPLESALEEFSRQTHLRVSYYTELSRGLTSSAVEGTFTPEAALRLLLAHTGLQFKYLDAESIAILRADGAPEGTVDSTNRDGRVALIAAQDPPFATDTKPSATGAEHQQMEPSAPLTGSGKTKNEVGGSDSSRLSEIVVTGSRIAHTADQGAQDVRVYDQAQIEQSGQTTVADFLNTLPAVSQMNTDAVVGSGGGTTVSLRGLPIGTTLVLINGRRVETSGSQAGFGDFFDLNNIPVGAIERIEVLADGSSAVYGSDAIAGIVNIILKKNFDGVDISAKQSWANGIDDTSVNAAYGKRFESGSVSIVGTYLSRGELDTTERTRIASNDYTPYGGPNGNQPVCPRANVFSLTGAPLPGAPAPGGAAYASLIPNQSGGKPTLANFSYGTLNQCGNLLGYSMIPASHRAGLIAQGSIELSPRVELFTELMYSRVSQDSREGFQSLYGGPTYQSYSMGPDNPYNPFGTRVGVVTEFLGLSTNLHLNTDFYRALVGARGAITTNWQWEVSAWDSMDSSDLYEDNAAVNSTEVQAALDSPLASTALNPFTTGSPASPSVLRQLFQDNDVRYWGREQSANGFVTGSAIELPGGPLKVVLGGEYDRDYLASDIVLDPAPVNTRTAFNRNAYAAFGEARVPLLAGATEEPMLTTTLAVRYDHYSDFGGTTNPQYGIEFNPVQTLLFRATYAKSFKAPPLTNLYQPLTALIQPITDPKTGASVSVPVANGGNPDLRPIMGRSYTYGLVWTSSDVPGLRVGITNWNITERELIEIQSAQYIVNNESLYPGRVTRDSSGNIVAVNDSSVNLGSIEIAGVDYSASYHKDTEYGTWAPTLLVTEAYHYVSQTVAGSPPISGLSVAQDNTNWTPRIKGTLALSWQKGQFGAAIDGRYLGKYRDYDTQRETGNYWVSDANWRYSVGKDFPGRNKVLDGAYLEVGAINLLNRSPQYSSHYYNLLGYDQSQEDIRGRVLYLQFGSKW